MKQFLIVIATILLFSCSSEVEQQPTIEELVEITFNVKSLDVDLQPMTRASVAASESELTQIYYYVYDAQHFKEYSGTQTAAEAGEDFGTIKLTLPPTSKCDFIFTGVGSSGAKGTYNAQFEPVHGLGYGSASYISFFDKDVFCSLDQNAAITAQTKNVNIDLKRCAGQLIINLTDTEQPEGIASLKAEYVYYSRYHPTSEEYTNTGTLTRDITYNGTGYDPIEIYLVPSPYSQQLKISAYDEEGEEVGVTTASVPIYANRRTIVTGNIADIFSGRDFTITVNEQWGSDYNIKL